MCKLLVQDNLNTDQVQAILCMGDDISLELDCLWNQQLQMILIPNAFEFNAKSISQAENGLHLVSV